MMISLNEKETVFPRYSLQESSHTGNAYFEIRKATGGKTEGNPLFLVPHRKDYYLLVYVKKGNSRHWVDFQHYTLQPHTFYFTVPRQVHLKEEYKPMEGYSVAFTAEFLQLEENRLLQDLPVLQNPYNQHALKLGQHNIVFLDDLMEKMMAEFSQEHAWQESMLQSYLKTLLIYLSRLYAAQFEDQGQISPGIVLLQKFNALIAKHFLTIRQVNEYADMLFVSPGHLNDTVKKHSGKTASELIQERLMLEAKRLLFHTDLSIKETAYRLGFEDPAYFNRLFKKQAGTTPASFRLESREMSSEIRE